MDPIKIRYALIDYGNKTDLKAKEKFQYAAHILQLHDQDLDFLAHLRLGVNHYDHPDYSTA